MHSKARPWSFFENFPPGKKPGLYGTYCFDPYLERLIQKKWSSHIKGMGLNHHVILGNEATSDWIDENLISLDLFGGQDSYMILNGEDIPTSAQEKILELDLSEKFLFISFSKSGKFFLKCCKGEGQFFTMEMPKFWESDKLLDFLARELGGPLNSSIKNYILTNITHEVGSFINALKLISIHFGSKQISLEELKEIIPPSRMDIFQLASLFGNKNKQEFFHKLIALEVSQKEWISFFNFMIGHLFKLTGDSKGNSQYERDLAKQRNLWSIDEINNEIKLFGELQIEAKGGNLKEKLRLAYLKDY
ncbi:MAG: hypothetical protein DRQ88_09905 [Epsilonproteobacteria bacterium]|nr:MAG: hypothetical protein DRQ89_10470 [Campylobacterota bacterium]RLA65011.1 MAG: hypothetical protein DRQ88_09905 [Campylobacterota bacterium]